MNFESSLISTFVRGNYIIQHKKVQNDFFLFYFCLATRLQEPNVLIYIEMVELIFTSKLVTGKALILYFQFGFIFLFYFFL